MFHKPNTRVEIRPTYHSGAGPGGRYRVKVPESAAADNLEDKGEKSWNILSQASKDIDFNHVV